MYDLTDKTVLVTGSTKGIGRAIAQRFIDEGARVLVHGRSRVTVESAREEMKAHAGVAADLGNAAGVTELLEQLEAFDPVDVLVNNTGIFESRDFFEVDDDEWQTYLDTNLMSVVRLSRALLRPMLERDSGRIVNISSEAGVKPLPQMIAYSVTKAALSALSRGLAELTKGTNVTVNSLLPGPTWTEGVASYFEGLAEQEGRDLDDVLATYFADHEPNSLIQRFADVTEVADGAFFLAANSAVNGSALRVEGGIIRSV